MKSTLLLLLFVFISSGIFAQVTVTTITEPFAGSGGVKMGPDGYLYVADFGTSLGPGNTPGTQVWRLKPGQEPEVFANGLYGASGNDFDSQGNLFQSNIAGGNISKIAPDGTVTPFVSSGIVAPVGIAIDGEDNLYVCNCGDNTIQKVSSNGDSEQFASGFFLKCPNGIDIDQEGNLYVSNFNNSNVIKIAPDGTPSLFAQIPGNNNGHLTYYAPDSIFYINSHGSSSVYRATLDGEVTKIAGSGIRGNDDGPADEATFSRPNGVAVSPDGDTLYLNSSIPTNDNPPNNPLNPSVIRMITGLKSIASNDKAILKPTFSVIAFPNPADDQLVLELEVEKPDTLEINIFDGGGKKVGEEDLGFLSSGSYKKAIEINELTPGVYYISVRGKEFSKTLSVLKN